MRRSELREPMRRRRTEQMRRRRAELRALLPRFRELARNRVARLERLPAFRAARDAFARRRRRQRTVASLALLLLLLLFVDCGGKPGPTAVLAKATPAASVKPGPKPTAPGPLQARLEPQKRPGYGLDTRPGPDWLDDFRLQVAARSPRLAECFNGSDRGGTLRWTVSVDAKNGTVADHDFEPLGGGNMRNEQKACATRALSDPAYHMENPPAEALPNRVSLVLEF